MAITYSNAFKEVIDALAEIIRSEFKMQVHFDTQYKAHATQYFNILPISNSVQSRFSGGSTREYNVEIKYFLRKGNSDKHTHIDFLTDIGERLTRLFNDKSNAESINDLFQGVLSQFVESTGTFASKIAYTFHDGRIENITYQPDRNESEELDDLHLVEFDFIAIVTEVLQ